MLYMRNCDRPRKTDPGRLMVAGKFLLIIQLVDRSPLAQDLKPAPYRSFDTASKKEFAVDSSITIRDAQPGPPRRYDRADMASRRPDLPARPDHLAGASGLDANGLEISLRQHETS